MKKEDPREYSRNLPHIQPEDGVFFITFRLHGSLPFEVIQDYRFEIELLKNKSQYNSSLQSFIIFDKYLDNAKTEINYLKNKEIAKIVKDAIHFLDNKDYKLICYCIMPTHVHIILYNTKRPLFRILQTLKRFTAKECNKILNLQGSFWQKESYDNLIENEIELEVKIDYVLQNPVKAGLVKKWDDWEFSWCKSEFYSDM
jgi:putative transposase